MSQNSGLAAVAAAAAAGATAPKSEQPSAQNAAAPQPMTVDRLKAENPDVYAAVFNAGGQAEHDRIIGIEKASLPGHDAIISAHKADRSKSPEQAAFAVLAAEGQARQNVLSGLAADEKKVEGLRSGAGATEQGAKPERTAIELAAAAQVYIAEQAAKGITVSAAEAVAHVEKGA